MKMVIIYEFVGLPGAGKTTISEKVIANIKERSKKHSIVNIKEIFKSNNESKFIKFIKHFRLCLKYPTVSVLTYKNAFEVGLSLSSIKRIYPFLDTYNHINKVIENTSDDILIADQGLLQDLWSIGIHGKTGEIKSQVKLVRKILQDLPIVIVNCEISNDIAVERIKERSTSNSRFDGMQANKALNLLKKQSKQMNQIIKVASKDVEVIDIDCEKSINQSVLEISNFILENNS